MGKLLKIILLPVYFYFLAEFKYETWKKNLKAFSLKLSRKKWKLEIDFFFHRKMSENISVQDRVNG